MQTFVYCKEQSMSKRFQALCEDEIWSWSRKGKLWAETVGIWETFMKDDWSFGDDGDLKQTSSTICTSANQMYWAGSESGIVLAGR